MKTYDFYKDSGIEWIGKIPSHWKRAILKRYCKVTDGSHFSPKTQETGFPYVSVKDIGFNKIDLVNCKRISEREFDDLVKNGCKPSEGDVLLTKDGTIGRAAVVTSDLEPFVVLSSLGILTPKEGINPNFLYFFLVSGANVDQMFSFIHGSALTRLTIEKIQNLNISIPSLQEQSVIASYLDQKTSEIDELIADKKRLLELYEEEKTAVINHAVTKGLDPNSPMKDSGIDWLGEIPEHWEVKKLKMIVTKVGSGVTPSGGSSVYLKEGIPLLRSQNIHFNGLKLEDVAYISEEIDQGMSNSRIIEDDILLNITGASIGRCFYVPKGFGKGNVNQHVCIIRPILSVIHPIYLYFLIRSSMGQVQIDLQQTGANREGLNFEQLKNFTLPIPKSISEQETIVEGLRKYISKIDVNISKTEKLIDLLTEYRTALISEVVTGKVKVID